MPGHTEIYVYYVYFNSVISDTEAVGISRVFHAIKKGNNRNHPNNKQPRKEKEHDAKPTEEPYRKRRKPLQKSVMYTQYIYQLK